MELTSDKKETDAQIYTDASDTDWAVISRVTRQLGSESINFRLLLTLQSFIKDKDKFIHILSDNVTTVWFLNNLGGNTPELITYTYTITYRNNIDICAKHLSGVTNLIADRPSRPPIANPYN